MKSPSSLPTIDFPVRRHSTRNARKKILNTETNGLKRSSSVRVSQKEKENFHREIGSSPVVRCLFSDTKKSSRSPCKPMQDVSLQNITRSPLNFNNDCAYSINDGKKVSRGLDQVSPIKTGKGTPAKSPCKNVTSPKNDSFLTPTKLVRFRTPPKSIKQLKSPTKSPVLPRTAANLLTVRQSPRKLDYCSPLRLARQHGACYQMTRQVLHTGLPERVLCRETEQSVLTQFLEENIQRKKSGSLYISGAPGTGKTAVVSNMMKSVKEQKRCKLVYINCMTFQNSKAIYNNILAEVSGSERNLSQKQALKEIEKVISSLSTPILLILDEIDQLDSKNQEVLYTMFEWPLIKNSKILLIGIANALDLTDRILPRLQARPKCKPQLLNFPPYTKEQIVKILKHRLHEPETESGVVVLDNMAIQFVARKISAIAGDIRKALDVCRRAIEMVEQEVRKQQILKPTTVYNSPSKLSQIIPKKVTVSHIAKVVNEVYGSVVSAASTTQTIPLQQKLAMCALLLLIKRNKVKETTIGKLHDAYAKICRRQEVISVEQGEFFSICINLQDKGIFSIKKTKDVRNAKVSLKLDEKEFEFALQDKTLMSAILVHGLS